MKAPIQWYYLDADNNKDSPAVSHCERCKRPFKETQNFEAFYPIVFHKDHPWFRIANPFEKNDGYIGSRCFERVKKEYGEQINESKTNQS